MKVSTQIRYSPRVWQQYIHNDPHQFRVVLAHRGGGKTFLIMGEIIKSAMMKKGVYAYIAPEKSQGKKVIWDPIQEMIRYNAQTGLGIPGIIINKSELRIEFPNGSVFYVLAGDQPENIRGMHLSGVVLDEVADIPMDAWNSIISPALMVNKGWAIFIGTPKKGTNLLNFVKDLGHDKHPDTEDWNSWSIDVNQSGVFTEEEIRKKKASMLKSKFDQEYLLLETASEGAAYSELLSEIGERGQIGIYPYQIHLPVHVGWDLGFNDYTVLWFGQIDPVTNKIFIIDYYRKNREKMSHYIQYLLRKPYRYGTMFLPHDAVKTHMDTENTGTAQLRAAGFQYKILPKTKSILQSIQAVQTQFNKLFFNKGTCAEGIDGLNSYDTIQDKKSGQFTDKFKHCDISDSFRYLMEGIQSVGSYERNYNQFKRENTQRAPKVSPLTNARRRIKRKK